jgi:hypothetical protein
MRKKFYVFILLILLLHQAGFAQTSMINVYGRKSLLLNGRWETMQYLTAKLTPL